MTARHGSAGVRGGVDGDLHPGRLEMPLSTVPAARSVRSAVRPVRGVRGGVAVRGVRVAFRAESRSPGPRCARRRRLPGRGRRCRRPGCARRWCRRPLATTASFKNHFEVPPVGGTFLSLPENRRPHFALQPVRLRDDATPSILPRGISSAWIVACRANQRVGSTSSTLAR